MTFPLGITLRLDPQTRVRDGGRTLVGGAPLRVLHLAPAARGLLRGDRLPVRDAAAAAFARILLDAGMAHPDAADLPEGDESEVTYVIPVRDRPAQLDRLLASIDRGERVIVVDDASLDPVAVARVAQRHGARVLALPTNQGPAAARNAGLRAARTRFVAFVDSDVELPHDTVAVLLRHFADPEVAIVAPRVVGLPSARASWVTRYEAARSSLDLGDRPALVRPRSPVSWVSSTMLLVRAEAVPDGFDAGMRCGEDVDLVWRAHERGLRVRYEPAATVWHEHRDRAVPWLARKAYYGTGAAPLSVRHPEAIAPAIMPPWGAAIVVAALAQRAWSVPAMIVLAVGAIVRLRGKVARSQRATLLASELVGTGLLASAIQAIALLLRHWWPVTAVAAVFSRRVRRAVLVAHIADVAMEWPRIRARSRADGTRVLDPVRFSILRRLDDLAYGAGVWAGVLRARAWRAVLPRLTRR